MIAVLAGLVILIILVIVDILGRTRMLPPPPAVEKEERLHAIHQVTAGACVCCARNWARWFWTTTGIPFR